MYIYSVHSKGNMTNFNEFFRDKMNFQKQIPKYPVTGDSGSSDPNILVGELLSHVGIIPLHRWKAAKHLHLKYENNNRQANTINGDQAQ